MSELITAKIKKPIKRISQCDIFKDVDILENFIKRGNKIEIKQLNFPYVICLNQDCDLNSDFCDRKIGVSNKNRDLIHLIVAPVFNFDQFIIGQHWGNLFDTGETINPKKTIGVKIMQNNDPRYHYLHFDEKNIPNMIIDFKHFFTVSRDYLYEKIDHRLFSISELYREKITQRFAFFQSRIGLPD